MCPCWSSKNYNTNKTEIKYAERTVNWFGDNYCGLKESTVRIILFCLKVLDRPRADNDNKQNTITDATHRCLLRDI